MLKRLLRCQRGQTGAEYLAALVLVSVVVGSVGTTQVGGYIEGHVQRLVCEIAAAGPCPAPTIEDREGQPSDSGRAPREVYDGNCQPDLPGDLLRETGGDPSGNAEADQVYENLGAVYDYLYETFDLESYDGDNALLVATVNYCEEPGEPFANAFWDGEQMVFGEGYGNALDITAHELAHAITDDTSDLEYSCESGALNESFSDIIASNVDTDDWLIGEDLPIGALRDMEHPENGRPPQPGHADAYMAMPNDRFNDNGGVHYNSGIPNRAYVLLVQSAGRDAAEQIAWLAFTQKLDSDAGFEEFRTAMLEAGEELYGADSAEYRATDESLLAVGLDGNWAAPEAEGC